MALGTLSTDTEDSFQIDHGLSPETYIGSRFSLSSELKADNDVGLAVLKSAHGERLPENEAEERKRSTKS